MKKVKNWFRSISNLTKAAICFFVFFICVAWYAYTSPEIRLDHIASLATLLGALATATTLIWLVVERDQLQKEKHESEKRKQANGVSVWLSKKAFHGGHLIKPIIVLNNNSDSPIYNLVVSVVDARDKNAKGEKSIEEFRKAIDASPPGQVYCFAPSGFSGAGFHPGAEIAFSDVNGSHWVRRGNGQLESIKEDPFTHYKIPQPPSYEPLHNF